MSESPANVSPSPAAGHAVDAPRYLPWVFVLGVAAALLRIWAARDEFWLDEIWSLVNIARTPHRFVDIFTLHHDNNHHLTSLWIDLVGPLQKNWIVYRVPSIVAGVGTVVLAALAARRWGGAAVLAATLLTSCSFVLVLYSSEARGYALAGFFALAAFLALDRYLAKPMPWAAIGFGVATILGTLGHLTCLQFYLGALAWSAVALRRTAKTRGEFMRHMAALHVLPLTALTILYIVDVRAMRIGGGDVHDKWEIVASAAGLAVGSPAERPWPVALSAVAAVVVAIAGIVQLWREKSDLSIFFAVTIFVSPAMMLVLLRPTLVYERYFYIPLVFFLLLASYVFARLVATTGAGRMLATAGLLAIIVGNLAIDVELLRVGRGHYLDALAFMADHSSNHEIHLAGDDDFDNQHYLAFYSNYLPEGWKCSLTNFWSQPTGATPPAKWLLTHSQARPFTPPPTVTLDHNGGTYELVRLYPCSRLSGYQFALYERARD